MLPNLASLALGPATQVKSLPANPDCNPPDSSVSESKTIKKTPKPKPQRGDGLAWGGVSAPPVPVLPWNNPPTKEYEFLTTFGYVIVQTPFVNENERLEARLEFNKMLRESPEFLVPDDAGPDWTPDLPVLGGFAAMGNPSSFHHPFVRRMREILLFTALTEGVFPLEKNDLVEETFDRVVLRRPGQKPTGESLHRDDAPPALDGDTLFGGWVNLDDTDQFFRCAAGTHLEVGDQNKGFAKITHPDEIDHYSAQIKPIKIDPGHMLVFYERIVHEVAAITRTDKEESMYRMHCGFRLTRQSNPLFDSKTTREWIETQAVPRIKSAQFPTVFPTNYTNFPDCWNIAANLKNVHWLPKWSQNTFVDEVLVDKVVGGNGQWAGTRQRRVEAVMKPLRAYFSPDKMHPPYSFQESALLFPQTKWPALHTRLKGHETKEVRLPSGYDWVMYDAGVKAAPKGATVVRPGPVVFGGYIKEATRSRK